MEFVTRFYRWARVGLAVSLLGACQNMTPESWAYALHPDFSTPERSGRSFLCAWRADQTTTEYLALSEELKREFGATLDGYLLYRDRLADAAGIGGRYTHLLVVLAEEEREDGRLLWWGWNDRPRIGLLMVPQHFYDLQEAAPSERRTGAFLDSSPDRILQLNRGSLDLHLEGSAIRQASRFDRIGRLELGTEWKIRRVLLPDQESQQD